MELKDTITLMESDDFKDRLKAEYWQTKIRYEKLHTFIIKLDAGTSKITPKTPIDILRNQAKYMGMYLYQLEVRAELEGIDLSVK